jgi:transposase-like protein
MAKPSSFRYFKTSPEIIRLAVVLYVRFPFSLHNVEDGSISIKVPKVPQDLAMLDARLSGQV